MAAIQAFLDQNSISQAELGDALGITSGAISRKLSGARDWKLQDVRSALAFLSERLGRTVVFAEVFGEDAAEPADDAIPSEPAPAEAGE